MTIIIDCLIIENERVFLTPSKSVLKATTKAFATGNGVSDNIFLNYFIINQV